MIDKYNKIVTEIVKKYLQKLSIDIYNEKLEYDDFDIMNYN